LNGEEYLRETLARNRGALVISGHTATWWTVPAALAERGYPVTAVFTPIHFRRVEKKLLAQTQRYNVKLAFVGRDAYLAARRAIEKNEILYLTFDVAVRANRARTFPFGDAWLPVDPGPAILAVRNGMPTLQAACVHMDDGRNNVSIYTPDPAELSPRTVTPDDLCRLWTDRLEKEVRLHPEQWWPWGYATLQESAAAPQVASQLRRA
jgi:KDO2-lipid IV(A) lauroyltransferase